MLLRRLAQALSVAAVVTFSAAPANAEGSYPDLEKCYQQYGQLEQTQQGGKKITVYKSQADVAADCNAKVVAKAKGVKAVERIKELAGIIGRNSNWQSAMPVYTEGAKADPKKAVCDDSDAWRSADLALSSPADHVHARGALAFFDTCWSVLKKDIEEKLDADSSSYHKQHLCKFLKGKKALPASKQALCND